MQLNGWYRLFAVNGRNEPQRISLQRELFIHLFVRFFKGEVQEWLNWHAWKACIPQGIEGSNPSLSAKADKKDPSQEGYFFIAET